MSTRKLVRLIFCSSKLTVGIENVTLSRIPLRYYLDSVTVILTAPSLQMYVMSRAVTEQIVTQSRRLVKFSVSKWLKLTQFHLFTSFLPHSLDEKSNFARGKPTRSTTNEPLGCKYLLLCVSKLEVFTQLPPAYNENILNFDGVLHRFPSTTQANSQVCFKWMSRCVI